MLERVGNFYVDTSEFPVEIVNRANCALVIEEARSSYPDEFFRFDEGLGINIINLSDFLPHWIILARKRLQAAETLVEELNLKIPDEQ